MGNERKPWRDPVFPYSARQETEHQVPFDNWIILNRELMIISRGSERFGHEEEKTLTPFSC